MPEKSPDEAVRIFIEFKTLPSAIKALTDLNGRFFGGRLVKVTFYNLDKFNRLELADED
jgi:splicing factor 45